MTDGSVPPGWESVQVPFPPDEWDCRYAIRVGTDALDVFRWTGADWELDRRLQRGEEFTVEQAHVTTREGDVWIRAALLTTT